MLRIILLNESVLILFKILSALSYVAVFLIMAKLCIVWLALTPPASAVCALIVLWVSTRAEQKEQEEEDE